MRNITVGHGPATIRHQETGESLSWSPGDPALEPGPGKWNLIGVNLPDVVVRRGVQICFPDVPQVSLGKA
jgi:hypothetical protein